MRKPHLYVGTLLAVTVLATGLWSVVAQQVSSTRVPVHMVVTVEPCHVPTFQSFTAKT